jgi:KDO2-lipid IV(A) lauroyltransferase
MFYLFYSAIWLVTWLPLRVLYLLSDLFFPVIYYIIPYRKKIVRNNLRNAFPEKTGKERQRIERKFYRFFCDMFVETLYLTHISEKEMRKRFDTGDNQIVKDYYAQGRSVMMMTAHYGNWEWGSSFSLGLPDESPVYNVYKKLHSKNFDKLMNLLRSRFKGHSVEMKELLRKMLELRKEGKVVGFAMISDQNPLRQNIHYWTKFMNQDTPIIDGTDQLARKFNYPVVYIHIRRLKRGYYRCEYHNIASDPQALPEFEICERYARILEQKIEEEPAYWLWTHKRWKHKKE